MPRGGKITISTENVRLDAAYAREHPEVVAGAYVLLRVKDTGCGMDATVRAHLFEPFFTTKEVGKGSGLGLATVFGIVKQSGGHIEVESELECGTTMKLYLPRSEERGHTLETSVPTGEVPAGTETVLLVEDEDGVRSLVRQVLGGCGYQLLEARHGEEALAISSQHDGPIDLVLTDVVMPRLSGVALAKRLEVLRPQTRVLFMSGFTDSALLRHGVHQGDVDCLLKPFTPEALARKVREVLDASLVTIGPNGHSSSRSGDGMERRTFARRTVRGRVILECWKGTVGTGPAFTAILVDISREGAGVAVRVPLEQGQQLEMVLTGPGSEKSPPLRAEVRWVAKVNDLEHRAGLHFDRRLSYDEFQQIVR
jgi:CheY-like chemotaxis protein